MSKLPSSVMLYIGLYISHHRPILAIKKKKKYMNNIWQVMSDKKQVITCKWGRESAIFFFNILKTHYLISLTSLLISPSSLKHALNSFRISLKCSSILTRSLQRTSVLPMQSYINPNSLIEIMIIVKLGLKRESYHVQRPGQLQSFSWHQ